MFFIYHHPIGPFFPTKKNMELFTVSPRPDSSCAVASPQTSANHHLVPWRSRKTGGETRIDLPSLETNMFAPEWLDGWHTFSSSFWGPAYFQGRTVSFREGKPSRVFSRGYLDIRWSIKTRFPKTEHHQEPVLGTVFSDRNKDPF